MPCTTRRQAKAIDPDVVNTVKAGATVSLQFRDGDTELTDPGRDRRLHRPATFGPTTQAVFVLAARRGTSAWSMTTNP